MLGERHISVASLTGYPPGYKGMDGYILLSEKSAEELLLAGRQSHPLDTSIDFDPMTLRQLRVVAANEPAPSREDEFRTIGYDVGFLNEFGTVHSLIVHYLLGNRTGGQTGFHLNSDLLFAEHADAKRLLAEWMAWSDGTGAKEVFAPGEVLRPYAISVARDSTEPAVWTSKWP